MSTRSRTRLPTVSGARCGAPPMCRFLCRVLELFGFGLVIGCVTACATTERPVEIRQWTDDLAFRISVTPAPPVAEEYAIFKVVVQDKSSGQPIETGGGRLFATNKDRAEAYDGLAKGKEPGTYYARLRFPVNGEWAIGLQFQRDSTTPLERTQDWVQTVSAPPPLGSDTGTTRQPH